MECAELAGTPDVVQGAIHVLRRLLDASHLLAEWWVGGFLLRSRFTELLVFRAYRKLLKKIQANREILRNGL